jgi:hypothetical protein
MTSQTCQNMVNLTACLFIRRRPSKFMNVTKGGICTLENNIFGCEKVYYNTGAVFSVMWSDLRLYNRSQSEKTVRIPREGGVEYLPVALRVVGGDEKGSLESETVRYGSESHGSRTRERLRWRQPAATVNDRPVLSSERVRHQQTRNYLTVIKIWS